MILSHGVLYCFLSNLQWQVCFCVLNFTVDPPHKCGGMASVSLYSPYHTQCLVESLHTLGAQWLFAESMSEHVVSLSEPLHWLRTDTKLHLFTAYLASIVGPTRFSGLIFLFFWEVCAVGGIVSLPKLIASWNLTVWPYLEIGSAQISLRILRWHHSGFLVGSKYCDWLGEETQRDTQGRRSAKKEEGISGMQLQAKECYGLPGAPRNCKRQGRCLPSRFQKESGPSKILIWDFLPLQL